jgi:hypothetical protein
MPIQSTDIPGQGTFTVIDQIDGYLVRIVFIDRFRLEFALSHNLTIDRNSVFRLLDNLGNLHSLTWSSQTLDTFSLSPYLEAAKRFVNSLRQEPQDSSVVEQELIRIRTARAIHMHKWDNS